MKKLIFMLCVAVLGLSGCKGKAAVEENAGANDSILVLYYSQTGATKAVAEELHRHLGGDIVAIEAVNPYPEDYDSTVSRWRAELADSVKVEIKPLAVSLDDYKTVFLGFPIWGGTYASPMATFLVDNSLAGKKVVTFATFGSGGIAKATCDVASAQPDADVVPGYGARNARIAKVPAEITRFLIENGYVQGEIEPLAEYSEAVEVTDSDVAIFNEACGSYKFPLGTPFMVGRRRTAEGTDYKFEVKSQLPDGSASTSTIYVTVANGEAPEFTEVVRY